MSTAVYRLENARKELLYLGLRNPLLNFRPLRARGLEIANAQPYQIFDTLVNNKQSYVFVPQPDKGSPPSRSKGQLETPYDAGELQKRLLNTFYVAQSHIEEQGVNILYMALGMLEWIDPASPDKIRQAPLLLVPVQLKRDNANDPFHLTYTDIDLGTNLSLEAKLRIDFNMQLPSFESLWIQAIDDNNMEDAPETPPFNVDDYFMAVSNMLAHSAPPTWRVNGDIAALGFFSFNKFLMYQDLNPDSWPAEQNPAEHPILNSLLSEVGFQPMPPAVPQDALIDPYDDLNRSHQIVGADSSQTLAILDAAAGRNLVIQGPPGTGKSQTIINLIAEAVGRGQTVLFVSEKLAALEVVKRRLDNYGLGDAALPLHSHKTTKRSLAAELHRTLGLGRTKQDGHNEDLGQLIKLRSHLNAYSSAMNSSIDENNPNSPTPYEAYGHLVRLEKLLDQHANWQTEISALGTSFQQLLAHCGRLLSGKLPSRAHREWLRQTEELLGEIGIPAQHPFYLSKTIQTQSTAASEINQTAVQKKRTDVGEAWLAALIELLTHTQNMADHLGIEPPRTMQQIDKLHALTRRAIDAPNLYAVAINDKRWASQRDTMNTILDEVGQLSQLHHQFEERLIPEAWNQNVLDLRTRLMSAQQRMLGRFSAEARQAKRELAGLCRHEVPDDLAEQIEIVDAIMAHNRMMPKLQAAEPTLKALWGDRYQGIRSDWFDLGQVSRWLMQLHSEIADGHLSADVLEYLSNGLAHGEREELEQLFIRLDVAYLTYNQHIHIGQAAYQLSEQWPLSETSLKEISTTIGRFINEAGRFNEIARFNHHMQAGRKIGLGFLNRLIEQWPAASQQIATLFQYASLTTVVEMALLSRPALSGFDGNTQDAAVETFRKLDEEFLIHNRHRLATEHWQTLPKFSGGGLFGWMVDEISKRSGHLPIRQFISKTAPILQKIKPVFMMSPLSIATFLPIGDISFDLVVFDEASQVRPVDAFGAILRGKQLIVVGDSRQLPPTTFFDRLFESETDQKKEEEWDEYDNELEFDGDTADVAQLIGDNESILELCVRQGIPERMLHWHYRSRHESLITISNREFYNNELVLFPSPDIARSQVGLRLHHNPATRYERGRSRTNPLEAEAVAQAVLDHAISRRQLTLGVATFSTAQRTAIEEAVETLRLAHPEMESFFAMHEHEPFFIKNLENVQGDERDIMFISIGYGRDTSGKVRLNFGPLNISGGERRLNVLITRARQRCQIFTNLTADDIDLRRTKSKGVAALKAYLAYAESGQLEELAPHAITRRTIFTDVVAAELTQMGYTTSRRVGKGGVEIDLAVHSAEKERYMMAIEFDGHDYYRAKSARDRDRIQQEVLAGLGWQIYRIWSTDWLRNPAEQRERLLAALKSIESVGYIISSEEPALILTEILPDSVERYDSQPIGPRVLPEYTRAIVKIDQSKYDSFSKLPHKVGASFLRQIVEVESPVHIEDAVRTLSLQMGLTRSVGVSGAPSYIIKDLVESRNHKPLVTRRGDFLWLVNMQTPPIRTRKNLPAASRNFELICDEEIQEATIIAVEDAIEIELPELVRQVIQLFGFSNLGKAHQKNIARQVGQLLRHGRLAVNQDAITQPRQGEDINKLSEAHVEQLLKQWEDEVFKRKASSNLPLAPAPIPYKATKEAVDIYDVPNFSRTGQSKAFMFGRIEYLFNINRQLLSIEKTKKRTYMGASDFPYGVNEITGRFELYASLNYQVASGTFTHNGYYGLIVTNSGLIRETTTRYRLWKNPTNGNFYGKRIASDYQYNRGRFYNRFYEYDVQFDPATGRLTDLNNTTALSSREEYEAKVTPELEAAVKMHHLEILEQIIIDEGPIHIDELTRRVSAAAGFKGRSPIATGYADHLLAYGLKLGRFVQEGNFIRIADNELTEFGDTQREMVRNRSQLPNPSRKVEYVPPDELKLAIHNISTQIELSRKNIYEAVGVYIGIRKPAGQSKKLVDAAVAELIDQGKLVAEGKLLKIASLE